MPGPWKCLHREVLADYKVFRIWREQVQPPRAPRPYDFYLLEAIDWVNVIPITPDGKVVFVRQYRYGTREVSLEIPGGAVDPDDPSPLEAARRELREETGYEAERLVYLGAVAPNPAILTNRCHTFLAENVRPVGPQQLDDAEEIEVVLLDPAEIPERIRRGEINHALVVAAFYLYEHRDEGQP
ncbi:NUDIX hydrolase [Rhodothermus marinus]|uniref:GDP-mannose pyrophosphatase n=1 Tax=Rhodothermus marinus (strain ATCC 43812 / DSM 4252 / R-10) TaxID=518766 RepID=D0MK35_RHOM4|nr:NUDIX hydrolase [Rhodothermus marinus]ACY46948.1 NUDIX hydrolase [Rhodothermus marinus DSM 4252]AEN71992.1 NUDIX hydrolase [Rhodothermus marinus SG0.5JP17-172]